MRGLKHFDRLNQLMYQHIRHHHRDRIRRNVSARLVQIIHDDAPITRQHQRIRQHIRRDFNPHHLRLWITLRTHVNKLPDTRAQIHNRIARLITHCHVLIPKAPKIVIMTTFKILRDTFARDLRVAAVMFQNTLLRGLNGSDLAHGHSK